MLGLSRRRPTGSGNPNEGGVGIAGLTAAGYRVSHDDTDQLRRLIQPWQSRAFSYYDQLGEIKYASQFYARMLAPLRLYAAKLDENGEWVEIEQGATGDDALAVDALDRIQDPGGGRESLLGSYGRLMFLAGECYMLCSTNEHTGEEQWEMLSTDELRIQSGVYIRYRSPTLAADNLHEIPDDEWELNGEKAAIAYRLWKRHPRYSMLADATMMGVLDLCEELLLLTRAVRARARSRLAGTGILAISEDFSHTPLEPTGDDDIGLDPFLSTLRDAMLAPISNEGAASQVVPIVIRGTTEAVEKGLRHIQIVDPTQLYPETGLRTECIHRIALGLDMPPEILEGLSDSNHWTSWQIDEQTWKAHGLPVANQLVNDLNAAYFRPQLKDDGVLDYMHYAIMYDPADIINHPNRVKDAMDLFDRVAIGHAALRKYAGVDEDDAPSKDERAERIGILTRDSSLAWFGTPAPRGGAVETAPGQISSDQPGDEETGEIDATGADVEKSPPEKPPDEPVTLTASQQALALARIAGAADLALLRAREAAGNRLLSLAKRKPEMAALLVGVSTREIAAVLGPDRVRQLNVTERELVAQSAALFRETLRMWGMTDVARVDLLVEALATHVLRTLYEKAPPPFPPQFQSYAAGVLERAA